MISLAFSDAQLHDLVGPLVSEVDTDAVGEVAACAIWTALAEPGDRTAWLFANTVGVRESLQLLERGESVAGISRRLGDRGVTDIPPAELSRGIARWLPRLKPEPIVALFRQAARARARLMTPHDPLWPAALNDLEAHAPFALWVRGTSAGVRALSGPALALVGARAATGYGEHATMEASAGLVDRGYTIVSGGAYGIDGMAHRAALASGGMTVAFLAGGVDRFYPSGHEALLTRIAETGAVISELPCGAAPTRWRFLHKNRCQTLEACRPATGPTRVSSCPMSRKPP